jgi:hypothetical protein
MRASLGNHIGDRECLVMAIGTQDIKAAFFHLTGSASSGEVPMDLTCQRGTNLSELRFIGKPISSFVFSSVIESLGSSIEEEALLQIEGTDIDPNAKGRPTINPRDYFIGSAMVDGNGLEVPAQIAMGKVGKDMRSFVLCPSQCDDISILWLWEPIGEAMKESFEAEMIGHRYFTNPFSLLSCCIQHRSQDKTFQPKG